MSIRKAALCIGLAALPAGCVVGPTYDRPAAPVPTHFAEAEGWKPAEPSQPASGTDWWTVYNDPVLDALVKQIDISNQTLKQAEAAWREAVAVAGAAGASLYPSVGLSMDALRSHSSDNVVAAGNGVTIPTSNQFGGSTARAAGRKSFSLAASASWDLDLWGKIRRTIESDVASAKASEADLAAARLSAQATLATDYVELRVLDEEKRLYDETVQSYERALQITQNQYNAGVVAKADVITAQAQLQGAQSQRIALGVQRAQLEHAIAVLIGKPPAEFSIAPAALGAATPVVPTGVPSSLLERRPDIAAAERQMAAANAQIGVAIAAYFPDLTLSASDGFASAALAGLFKASSAAWSLGGSIAATLIDFGSRKYQVQEARAAYDQTVAAYRQTVLTAFQQVEDDLAALRILEQQYAVAEQTLQSANQALTLTLNEYRAGTLAYTSVATAQVTALNAALSVASIRENRLTASIALIQALGGGWSAHSRGEGPP
jgi:NodT family efflux transporter outer membrane factor (OMF) lipoprotein